MTRAAWSERESERSWCPTRVQMECLLWQKGYGTALFRIAPGADSGGSYSHEGEEFIYVLQGKFEMWIDEIEHYALEAGDSLYFESTHAHRWRSSARRRPCSCGLTLRQLSKLATMHQGDQ